MALIECPECKAQISDQAAACPQCGCPAAVAAQEPVDDAESSPISEQPSAESLWGEVEAASTDTTSEEPAAEAAAPPTPKDVDEPTAKKDKTPARAVVPGFLVAVIGVAILLPAPGVISPEAAIGAAILGFGLVMITPLWSRVFGSMKPSKRSRLRLAVGATLIAGLVSGILWQDARRLGVGNLAEYRAAVERQRKKASRTAARATEAVTTSKDSCRQDLNCWGNRHVSKGVYCEDHIERLAQYSHQWTDGFLEPKFSRFRWKDQSAGTLTLIGDKIQFQNGLGAWQNHTYQCDIDPETDTVLGVRASPGRLPPPG